MKIIIAGAGDVGTHLAKMLSKENHTIVLLDENLDVRMTIVNGTVRWQKQ